MVIFFIDFFLMEINKTDTKTHKRARMIFRREKSPERKGVGRRLIEALYDSDKAVVALPVRRRSGGKTAIVKGCERLVVRIGENGVGRRSEGLYGLLGSSSFPHADP